MPQSRRKWSALALLCTVQFMVVLDIAVENVALPSIQTDLGFSQENLQWVISAYALLFGGVLLLGRPARPPLRRLPAARRPRRRPPRPPAGLPRRHRRVHGRLAVLRPRLERELAHRRARPAGPRRGDHLAGRAVDPHDHVRRGP